MSKYLKAISVALLLGTSFSAMAADNTMESRYVRANNIYLEVMKELDQFISKSPEQAISPAQYPNEIKNKLSECASDAIAASEFLGNRGEDEQLENVKIHLLAAEIYNHRGVFKDAISRFEVLVLPYVKVLLEQEQDLAAAQNFTGGLDPNMVLAQQAYEGLGNSYYGLKEYGKAKEYYNEAKSLPLNGNLSPLATLRLAKCESFLDPAKAGVKAASLKEAAEPKAETKVAFQKGVAEAKPRDSKHEEKQAILRKYVSTSDNPSKEELQKFTFTQEELQQFAPEELKKLADACLKFSKYQDRLTVNLNIYERIGKPLLGDPSAILNQKSPEDTKKKGTLPYQIFGQVAESYMALGQYSHALDILQKREEFGWWTAYLDRLKKECKEKLNEHKVRQDILEKYISSSNMPTQEEYQKITFTQIGLQEFTPEELEKLEQICLNLGKRQDRLEVNLMIYEKIGKSLVGNLSSKLDQKKPEDAEKKRTPPYQIFGTLATSYMDLERYNDALDILEKRKELGWWTAGLNNIVKQCEDKSFEKEKNDNALKLVHQYQVDGYIPFAKVPEMLKNNELGVTHKGRMLLPEGGTEYGQGRLQKVLSHKDNARFGGLILTGANMVEVGPGVSKLQLAYNLYGKEKNLLEDITFREKPDSTTNISAPTVEQAKVHFGFGADDLLTSTIVKDAFKEKARVATQTGEKVNDLTEQKNILLRDVRSKKQNH